MPLLAHGKRSNSPILIAGRIDRLVEEPGRIVLVDFKSDAVPPATEAQVPPGYLTQLGLYALVAGQLFPGVNVEAGILWTELETFMNLSQDGLRKAVEGFTVG
jgi:ATP-dependent helicase/nuclease subunit A